MNYHVCEWDLGFLKYKKKLLLSIYCFKTISEPFIFSKDENITEQAVKGQANCKVVIMHITLKFKKSCIEIFMTLLLFSSDNHY